MDNLKLLAIVTGEGEFVNKNLRTGLWLSELTHIYHGAKKQGIEITVASPKGGDTPIDPESLNPSWKRNHSGYQLCEGQSGNHGTDAERCVG